MAGADSTPKEMDLETGNLQPLRGTFLDRICKVKDRLEVPEVLEVRLDKIPTY